MAQTPEYVQIRSRIPNTNLIPEQVLKFIICELHAHTADCEAKNHQLLSINLVLNDAVTALTQKIEKLKDEISRLSDDRDESDKIIETLTETISKLEKSNQSKRWSRVCPVCNSAGICKIKCASCQSMVCSNCYEHSDYYCGSQSKQSLCFNCLND